MFITISGDLGSGKSTIAKLIRDKYGFEYYSTGDIFRQIAIERGMTVLELNKFVEEDINNEVDKIVDSKTVEVAENNKDKNVLFDSRMAWYFVKDSFKVYITVDVNIAAERVLNSPRGKVEKYLDKESAVKALLKRKEVEDIRYNNIYKVDCKNASNYNLILDSSYETAEELAEKIISGAREYYENK